MKTNTSKVEVNTIDNEIETIKSVANPLKTVLEDIINNAPVGNILACYDTGAEFNSEEIAQEAAEFVLKGLLGALCYNVIDGRKNQGQKMLNDALDQVDRATEQDAQFRSEKSADRLHNRIVWAARMDVQQAYRASLEKFVLALYIAVTGERYQRHVPVDLSEAPASPEQSVAQKLRARRTAI